MKDKVKKKLTTLGNRLLRMPRTRGFGVQSPTAYSFLRKVVNERIFLASYNQKPENDFLVYPYEASRHERLLFRLRHYYHHNLRVVKVHELSDTLYYEQVFSDVDTETVLLVTEVNSTLQNKVLWKKMIHDKRSILTFDLLDCGVVFFDNTKFKQHFKVNY